MTFFLGTKTFPLQNAPLGNTGLCQLVPPEEHIHSIDVPSLQTPLPAATSLLPLPPKDKFCFHIYSRSVPTHCVCLFTIITLPLETSARSKNKACFNLKCGSIRLKKKGGVVRELREIRQFFTTEFYILKTFIWKQGWASCIYTHTWAG